MLFTDQNSNPLKIEEKINITLVINESITYEKWHSISKKKKRQVRPRDRIFEKGYGFFSSAKNMDRNISENLSSKYNQKLLDHAKQSATDALKTSTKRVIQEKVAATGDLIGNKIADKFTTVSKSSPQNNLETNEEMLGGKYISPESRQKIIDDLKLKKD